MTLGVVYCAVCESYPGRCKIGKTFRNAAKRISELQRHYGSHHPFTEYDSKLVDHYSRVEWLAHRRLEWLGYYREPATEMFNCSPGIAMEAIAWATAEALRNPPQYKLRPERAHHAGGGRGTNRKHTPWRLCLAAVVVLIIWGLHHYQPGLPDWLPEPIQHAAELIESFGER